MANSKKDTLIRTAYDGHDTSVYAITFTEPSLTKQAFADECDINNIIARFSETGVLEHYNERAPVYADVSSSVDFQSALNIVIAGQTAFETLSSKIRERFGNDPAKFMEFIHDPSNRDEAVKLGLVEPPAPESSERAHNAGADDSGAPLPQVGESSGKPLKKGSKAPSE